MKSKFVFLKRGRLEFFTVSYDTAMEIAQVVGESATVLDIMNSMDVTVPTSNLVHRKEGCSQHSCRAGDANESLDNTCVA